MNATKYEPMKGLSNGTRPETFALVTKEPNEPVSQIHERLALILHPKDYDRWLGVNEGGDPRLLLDLLHPFELRHDEDAPCQSRCRQCEQ